MTHTVHTQQGGPTLADIVNGLVVINGQRFSPGEIHDPAFKPPGHVGTVHLKGQWPLNNNPTRGKTINDRTGRLWPVAEVRRARQLVKHHLSLAGRVHWPSVAAQLQAEGFKARHPQAIRNKCERDGMMKGAA